MYQYNEWTRADMLSLLVIYKKKGKGNLESLIHFLEFSSLGLKHVIFWAGKVNKKSHASIIDFLNANDCTKNGDFLDGMRNSYAFDEECKFWKKKHFNFLACKEKVYPLYQVCIYSIR